MYRLGISMVVGALFGVGAAAQSQAAQTGASASGQASVDAGHTRAQANASSATSVAATAQGGEANAGLANGTAFNAALGSPLDSKKSKPGDAVNARTTEAVKSEGKTIIPRGAKLVGHVTQASSRAQGETESALGLEFDKAILKNGQEIPLHVAIRALASAQNSTAMGGDEEMDARAGLGGSAGATGMAGGRGAIGGVTSATGAAVGTVTNTAANVGGAAGSTVESGSSAAGNVVGASRGAIGGLNAAGQLTSNSQGVFGLNGLRLSATASDATEGSVITSAGKTVHLDSGTRMLLVTEAQAGTASHSEHAAESKGNPKSKPEKP